jgi:hypothetical protein
MESVMPTSPNAAFAPFAALPGFAAPTVQRPQGLAAFFLAPFRDVDDRAARKTAALRADREARQAAISAAAGLRRA